MNWRWLFLIPIIWACDDYNDCGISDYSEELYLGFYDIEDESVREVSFDSVRITYASGERLVFLVAQETNGLALPIDLADTVTNYHFITDSAKYHLKLWYNREAILENPDCGLVFRIKGVQADSYDESETPLDSVAIQVTELSKLVSPHVEVYF